MRFDKFIPSAALKPYIKYFLVLETDDEKEYKVLPSPGLVMGFQYKGKLAIIQNGSESQLATAGITGIADSFKTFKNSPGTGTVLVYFTETGFTHFASNPAHELFNLSLSLEPVFNKEKVAEAEEKLALAATDKQRIRIVEQFLLSHQNNIETDRLIVEAVKLIYQSLGTMRIGELHKKLFISQSPFEKRFRKIVGTTPKKFASVVRLNSIIHDMNGIKSLTDICYEYNFFDQAHFIKDFKQFTGDTPEQFNRSL